MDRAKAISTFWESFGLPAYDENTVPLGDNAPEMPYITYSVAVDTMDYPTQLNASLWYRSMSWAEISQKADEISKYLGVGGVVLPLDNRGYVWFNRGQPFAQRMSEENDDTVRRIYLNIQAEFLTAY